MSALDEPVVPTAAAPPAESSFWRRLDERLAVLGDRLNPILVKEARQSLKAKQFVVTFGLVLAACWLWSVVGLMLIGPSVFYAESGRDMFYGYYVVLAFPLLVIVPFGAYRSLAAEREDRTHELVSITGLNARQVIGGKLASAALEIVVYLSAVLPCMAFAYLLRGIDFPSMALAVFHTALASLGLTVIGLTAATTAKERFGHVVISVVLILGTFGAFAGALGMVAVMLDEINVPQAMELTEFWIVNGIVLSVYLTYGALLFLVAAGQLGFASSNRSTGIRVVTLVQQLVCIGWTTWGWVYLGLGDGAVLLLVVLILVSVHWYAMGVFMSSESPDLSPRVRRGLPRSFLGRVFGTWFNPGPGTGYVFVLANLAAAALLAIAVQHWKLELRGGQAASAVMAAPNLPPGGVMMPGTRPGVPLAVWSAWDRRVPALALVLWGYVAFFLGLGKLLVAGIRRLAPIGLAVGFVVHVLLVLAASGIPLLIQFSSPTYRYAKYTLLQVGNPIWSIVELIERGTPSAYQDALMTIVPLAGLAAFLVNVPGIATELRYVRIAKPERVAQEDAELAAKLAEPEPPPIDPLA